MLDTNSDNLIVKCTEDCGNAPKKQMLKDFTVALAKNDIVSCLEWVREDIVWEIIGEQKINGIDEYEQKLIDMKERNVKELQIENIITHGNTCSVNGTLIFNDLQSIAFCDVYNFAGFGKNAKIKRITSYIIKIS